MPDKKRLLLISYYFPPLGMGGVQRAAKFAQYLPEYGWDVTVLTVRDIAYYARDRSLLNDVKNVDIQRTGSLDPLRLAFLLSGRKNSIAAAAGTPSILSRIFRFIDRKLFVPDSKILWNGFAFRRAVKLVKTYRFSAVLSTAPPFSTHLLAMKIAKILKIPWIADFRDGWTTMDFLPPERKLYMKFHRYFEKKTIRKADTYLAVSQKILNDLAKDSDTPDERGILIYNGYDEQDFTQVPPDRSSFNLTFMGTVTKWADPSVFFKAIRAAADLHKSMSEYLKINIVGNILDSRLIKTAGAYDLENKLIMTGYLEHKKAVELVCKSQVLLFPITNLTSPGVITGKLFEYCASGKPIVAYVPEGEASNLLREMRPDTHFCTENNYMETADYIKERFLEWEQGSVDVLEEAKQLYKNPNFNRYTRRYQTGRVADILNTLTQAI
ncbi:glycosyltransferase [candidate division KSB1 bacterium]